MVPPPTSACAGIHTHPVWDWEPSPEDIEWGRKYGTVGILVTKEFVWLIDMRSQVPFRKYLRS
jgi:hypothetical protein